MRPVLKISLTPQDSIYIRLIAIMFSGLAGWSPATHAAAAVYECKAGNGSIVLTDRPKSFHACVLVETMMSPPSRNGGGTAPTDLQISGQSQGDPAPSAAPLPQMPPLPPRTELFEPRPTGPPPTPSERESQPCPPGVNPLNPLTRGHCTRDAPQSPDITQEPLQSSP
jgi:hypothetical protein